MFVDAVNQIIAVGPTHTLIEKLPSAPFTEWKTKARIVLRQEDKNFHVSRQILDERGNHFEYQHDLPFENFRDAVHSFTNAIKALTLLQDGDDYSNASQVVLEPLKPKQIGAILIDGKMVPIARTFDVVSSSPSHDFALTINSDRFPHTIYRNSYDTLRKMVEKHYPMVRWLEASEWDI